MNYSEFKHGMYVSYIHTFSKKYEMGVGRISIAKKGIYLCQDMDNDISDSTIDSFGYEFLYPIDFNGRGEAENYSFFTNIQPITKTEYNNFLKGKKVEYIGGYKVNRRGNKFIIGCGRINITKDQLKEVVKIIKPIIDEKSFLTLEDLSEIIDILKDENINISTLKKAEKLLKE